MKFTRASDTLTSSDVTTWSKIPTILWVGTVTCCCKPISSKKEIQFLDASFDSSKEILISPTTSNFLNNSPFYSKNDISSLIKTWTLVLGRLYIQTKRYTELPAVNSREASSAFVKHLFEKLSTRTVPSQNTANPPPFLSFLFALK